MNSKHKPGPAKIMKWITLGIFAVAAFGWITMLLWNWLMPALFDGAVATISYWQAMGILVLSKILFSGFGGGKGHGHGCGGSHHCGKGHDKDDDDSNKCRSHWKSKFHDKMSNMSEEDKEAVKEQLAGDGENENTSEKTE